MLTTSFHLPDVLAKRVKNILGDNMLFFEKRDQFLDGKHHSAPFSRWIVRQCETVPRLAERSLEQERCHAPRSETCLRQ
jgi:hypothetical protein